METSDPESAQGLPSDFNTLVREHGYHTRELSRLTEDVDSMSMEGLFALLKPVSDEVLQELDTLPELRDELGNTQASLDVTTLRLAHFKRSMLRHENVLVVASIGLWGTSMHCNDLISALRCHFLSDIDEGRRQKKVKLPLVHFFYFLNHMHIDVLVMSIDKEQATIFRARKRKRSVHPPPQEIDGMHGNELPASTEEEMCMNKNNNSYSKEKHQRHLLALEYDPSNETWTPLHLPKLRWHRKVSFDLPKQSVSGNLSIVSSAFVRTHADFVSTNFETMALEQTVYNPQRVFMNDRGNVLRGQANKGSDSDVLQSSPFSGMKYPTIEPLTYQFFDVLRRGLDPMLKRNRLRFFIALPLAMLAFIVGLALIIYVSVSMQTCCRNSQTGECATSENTCLAFCDAANNTALYGAQRAFLFFDPRLSPGRYVVAATCCVFVAALLTVAVNYFTTRTIARKNARPRFYLVMMISQILLCAVACAFSAYALSIFTKKSHSVSCSIFNTQDAAACFAAQSSCVGFSIKVYERSSSQHVTLALSVIFLFICVLAFIASLIPPMPPADVVKRMPKATPETYVFYPSFYAPDGITKDEKIFLQQRIERQLRLQLRQEVVQSEFLLTRTATIGEMMQANREQRFGDHNQRDNEGGSHSALGGKEELQKPMYYVLGEDMENWTKDTLYVNEHPLTIRQMEDISRITSRVGKRRHSSHRSDQSDFEEVQTRHGVTNDASAEYPADVSGKAEENLDTQ